LSLYITAKPDRSHLRNGSQLGKSSTKVAAAEINR
jgi:hypothetical protein